MNSILKSGDRKVSVPFLDLVSLLASREITLLKCDIEGAEELFLEHQSSLLDHTRVAVFEMHGDLCDVPKCEKIIQSHGLRLHSESGQWGILRTFVRA